MKRIIHVLTIITDPKTVFDAVSTKKGLSNWWSTNVEIEDGSPKKVCFIFRGDFNPTMEVTDLEKPDKLSWRCIDGHDPWYRNKFSFDITKKDGNSQLTFIQDYEVELSDEAYGIYNFNWGYYLQSLKLFCETGKGNPYDPENQ